MLNNNYRSIIDPCNTVFSNFRYDSDSRSRETLGGIPVETWLLSNETEAQVKNESLHFGKPYYSRYKEPEESKDAKTPDPVATSTLKFLK